MKFLWSSLASLLLWQSHSLADDTAFFNALLASPSNTIVLAPGTYHLDQIMVPAGKTLIGGQPRPTIIHSTSNSPMLTVSSGTTLENIAFTGFWATNNVIGEVCMHAGSVTGIVLRSLAFDHFQYAIESDHTGENFLPPSPVGSGMRIENCSFLDVARGANIVNSRSILCNSNTLARILEHGLQFWGYWDVIPTARFASDITFIGNVVSNVSGGAGIWGSAGDRILMQSNRVVMVGDMCLDLELCADSQIRDNYAEGAYYGGIGVYFSASNIVVSNNMVVNNRYAPQDINGWWVRAGIWLNDASFKQYVTLIGNTITNTTDLPRRSIWVQSTNVNHIAARYNRTINAPNYWENNTMPFTNFTIINGVLTGLSASDSASPLSSSLVPATQWRFYKGQSSAPTTSTLWTIMGFDDSAWLTGNLPFWYGDLSSGYELTDMMTNYTTVYLRHPFVVGSPSSVTSLTLHVDYDDAMAIWLNGTMAWSSTNCPPTLAYTSTATVAHNWSGDQPGFAQPAETISISPSLVVSGTNIIAIMSLNSGLLSSDLHIEMSLNANFNAVDDQDQDGLPDGWELQWFGSLGNTVAESDQDGDGLTDEEEFRADTNPSDPDSNLNVASSSLDTTNGVVFTWPAQPNRTYGLRAANTMTSSWNTIASSVTSTPPVNVYTAAPSTQTRFYRVHLE